MIKVVELVPTLNMGGAESMIKDYCLLFDKEKTDVKVVVMAERIHTTIEKELCEAGVDVTYLGESIYAGEKRLNPAEKAIRFLGRYIFFKKTVTEFKPDVIHCHLHVGNYLRFIPIKKLGCKLILTVHNVTSRYFDKTGRDKKKYREYREVYRLIHRHGMQLIALHDAMNKELREYFATENVITVTNGIKTERFDPSMYDRNKVREALGIDREALVIGNVGRLHKQKNHELILDVFRSISAGVQNARLILVGAGELEQVIRDKIKEYSLNDKVIMLSNRSDIPELMSAMDVFLFPSLWEGFGNVLIEAQCMGLPCVISDAVPASAVISDGITVCRLEDSTETWIDAVIKCSHKRYDPDKDIRTEYDIINSVRKLEDIYSKSA